VLKRLILGRLAAVERDTGYDVGYLRDLLDADLKAFLRFSKILGISTYRRDLPVAASFAAKLVGTLVEDCGPCTQLMATMAEREGVSADTLRAVLRGDDSALGDDVRLSVRFARASLRRDPAVDELRDQVLARWGKRGLVSLAFALVASRVFPTLKYALGHGRACSRVVVAGTPVSVPASVVREAAVSSVA
jgi:alkylhydroperoxidase family enzyme